MNNINIICIFYTINHTNNTLRNVRNFSPV